MRFTSFLFMALFVSPLAIAAEEGVLTHIYGDYQDPNKKAILKYHLETSSERIELQVSSRSQQEEIIKQLAGQPVRIQFIQQGKQAIPENGMPAPLAIQSIEPLPLQAMSASNPNHVSGSQPWISILCKFSDINDEPKNLQYFKDMYDNAAGRLDHYWQEVSYGAIDVEGSTAVNWVTLPSPRSTYITSTGMGTVADLDLLFSDCTEAADDLVDFSDSGNGESYTGINMMFNANLDGPAWGGADYATLDGLEKLWSVTFEPPWAYSTIAIMKHEMGHGFGLPHADNSDGDGNPYDNPWDVMSVSSHVVVDPDYGARGQHINMEFKRFLGWVPDSEGLLVDPFTDETITIDNTTVQSTANKRFAKIPLSDGSYYIIEARKESGDYDANLPGTAVIIYNVVPTRLNHTWIIDEDEPPATFSDNEGVMWKVGEIFTDPVDGYTVEILESTAEGFKLQINASDVNIDGNCGESHSTFLVDKPTTDLCFAGDASVVSDTSPWTWDCEGIRDGTTASCEAFPEDSYEDNNTLALAYDLSSQPETWLDTILGLGIVNDPDVYEIKTTPGRHHIEVDLIFTQSEGDLSIELYNGSESLVAFADTATDNEHLSFDAPAENATYFIWVSSSSSIGNTYNLSWSNVLPGDCTENGTISQADVSCLVNKALELSPVVTKGANCNEDNNIGIEDVVCTINLGVAD